jgi:hypothetical protein
MPRLIELAVAKAIERDGDPFFCYFINSLTRGWIFKLQQYQRTGGQMQAVLNPKAELPV